MLEDGRPGDCVTLVSELGNHGELERCGDVTYITGLDFGVVQENISSNVRIIREAARDRRFAGLYERLGAAKGMEERLEIVGQMQDYASETTGRILTLDDIPDPFSLPGGEVEWAVEQLIPKNGVTLIIGDPGCGKTWQALSLGHAASLGGQFLGREVMRMAVLYLDRENPLGLIRERLNIL
jgi:hypothetical protein